MASEKQSGPMPDDVPLLFGRQQAANYIAELAGQLAVLARRHQLGTLAYLLDMAQMEANEAQRVGLPDI